jgi:putative flippase GtrA
MRKTTRQARVAVPGDRGPVAAFIRFVVCGGGVTLLSSAVLLLAAGHAPFAAANAVVTAASTLLATELHHRFTFNSRPGKGSSDFSSDRHGAGIATAGFAGWRIHAKSALTLLVAYLFTTAAVLLLGAAHPHPSPLLAQAVYLAASGLAGTGRFLVLRLVVFARRPATASPAPLHQGEIAAAA